MQRFINGKNAKDMRVDVKPMRILHNKLNYQTSSLNNSARNVDDCYQSVTRTDPASGRNYNNSQDNSFDGFSKQASSPDTHVMRTLVSKNTEQLDGVRRDTTLSRQQQKSVPFMQEEASSKAASTGLNHDEMAP